MVPVIEYYKGRLYRIRYGKKSMDNNLSNVWTHDVWGYHIEKRGWFGYYEYGFQPSLGEARDDLRRILDGIAHEQDFDD